MNPFYDADVGSPLRRALGPLLEVNGVTIGGWLTAKRLLEYLLESELELQPARPEFSTTASLLLIETRAGGVVKPLHIATYAEPNFAYYLDPVVLGLTVVDAGIAELFPKAP